MDCEIVRFVMVYKVLLNPDDPEWQSCSQECWERLPELVTGHIYQHWDGGQDYVGVLTRDPDLLTVYSGMVTAPDLSEVKMLVVFCYEEFSALLMYCQGEDFCLARQAQVINWYCFPFAYLSSDDGLVSYKVTL